MKYSCPSIFVEIFKEVILWLDPCTSKYRGEGALDYLGYLCGIVDLKPGEGGGVVVGSALLYVVPGQGGGRNIGKPSMLRLVRLRFRIHRI